MNQHGAQPPDFELMLLQDEPGLWVTLMLLSELRRRAPHAIDWTPLQDVAATLDAFDSAQDGG